MKPAYIHIQSCVSQSGWRDPVLQLVAWVERLVDGIFPQQPFHPHKLAHLLIADAHLHRQLHISQCGQCKSVQTDTKTELTRVLKQICLGQTELQPLRFITFVKVLCQCRVKGFTETLKCRIILSLMVVKCSPNSKTSKEFFSSLIPAERSSIVDSSFFILQGLESEKPAHQFKDVTWPH